MLPTYRIKYVLNTNWNWIINYLIKLILRVICVITIFCIVVGDISLVFFLLNLGTKNSSRKLIRINFGHRTDINSNWPRIIIYPVRECRSCTDMSIYLIAPHRVSKSTQRYRLTQRIPLTDMDPFTESISMNTVHRAKKHCLAQGNQSIDTEVFLIDLGHFPKTYLCLRWNTWQIQKIPSLVTQFVWKYYGSIQQERKIEDTIL